MKRLFLLAALVALFAGCNTVRIADLGGHTTVDIENTCWSILGCLPIASGDPEEPNADICCWFTNAATLDGNMKLLDWAMKRKGCSHVVGVTSRNDTRTYLFILKRKAWQTSAELVK